MTACSILAFRFYNEEMYVSNKYTAISFLHLQVLFHCYEIQKKNLKHVSSINLPISVVSCVIMDVVISGIFKMASV